MGRKRIIDRDAVLDAAERVVQRDGAVNLTISAVAEEAGISKASVLYDFKTKNALIGAVVARQIAQDDQRMQACVAEARDDPAVVNPEIACRIRFAGQVLAEQDYASAMTLCVAMAADDSVRTRLREVINKDMTAFIGQQSHASGALLAFLAMQGYMWLKYFDFYTFPDGHRDEILADIEKLTRLSANTLQSL